MTKLGDSALRTSALACLFTFAVKAPVLVRILTRTVSTVLLLLGLAGDFRCEAAGTITATEAAAHVGEHETVCGVVASAKYATSTRGQPTFLNLDRPYPNHIFTALIWGDDRPAFKVAPEVAFQGKRICVTGTIETYKGKPEIIVHSPSAINDSPAH